MTRTVRSSASRAPVRSRVVTRSLRTAFRLLIKLRLVWFILASMLFLTGCIQYDVGINYASQTHGEIVQHIQVSDRFTSFSGTVADDWLKSIEKRTRQLGGKTRRPSSKELVVTIPFNNGADLEAKFNEFFQSDADSSQKSTAPSDIDLPKITSKLQVQESNFLLLQRNVLTYDLDLRSLGVLSSDGNLLVSPGSLITLEFKLNTPWGARRLTSADRSQVDVRQQGHQLIWTLHAGQDNHLSAAFWVPSPLGIGTVVIVLFVIAGASLKSFLDPPLGSATSQPAPTES